MAAGLLPILVLGGASDAGGGGKSGLVRYRVEQVLRLETTSAEPQPLPGRLHTDPVTTAVEGRVRLVLEQRLKPAAAGQGTWRFTQVEVEGPRTEPLDATNPEVERALGLGLNWMRRLEGQEYEGAIADLPVLPLGEAGPPWLTAWLRWAQTGSFAGIEADPVVFPLLAEGEAPAEIPREGSTQGAYEVGWLRSEFRQRLCHVQRARWTLPVEPAPDSLSAGLAAEGVEARTHFAAQSLEWVSQQDPTLIYAERSGVRETFWDMEKVTRPELRGLVFRLRLGVQVRVERLP